MTAARIGGVAVEVVAAASAVPGGVVAAASAVPGGVVAAGSAVPGGVVAAGSVVVVHFHGGGYCVGGPFVARGFAAQLAARAGVAVVLPDYRLAPEHPAPAALHDALAVLGALDAAGTRFVLSGDSAGAGLALAVAQHRRDSGEHPAAGLVLHCPWLDLTVDAEGRGRTEDPDLVRRDVVLRPSWLAACARAYAPAGAGAPEVSPLLGSLRGLPPILVQAAGDDLLRTDSTRLAVAAAACGADVRLSLAPGMWHDYATQAGLVAAAGSAVGEVASAVTGWR